MTRARRAFALPSMRALALFCALAVAACTHPMALGAREVNMPGFHEHLTQIELQQALQRYAGTFIERARLSFEPLFAAYVPSQPHDPLQLYLRYASSVLDAATGQVPEVNALDMLVFVVLTRASVERYWLPEVYGEQARPLLQALRESERTLWSWAEDILARDKREQLRSMIERWLHEHPDQVAVESLRFAEFSTVAADVERNRAASGILSSIRSATQTADAMLLLSERALFLAQRAPFLLRMQTRVGAREVLSDAVSRLGDVDALLQKSERLLERADTLRPLVEKLVVLSSTSQQSLEEARALASELRPIVAALEPLLRERTVHDGESKTGVEELVLTTRALSESARHTLNQASELMQATSPIRARGALWLERYLRRLVVYATLAVLVWSAIFWSGYYLSRRFADARGRARSDDEAGSG